jgi:hypothetical protein
MNLIDDILNNAGLNEETTQTDLRRVVGRINAVASKVDELEKEMEEIIEMGAEHSFMKEGKEVHLIKGLPDFIKAKEKLKPVVDKLDKASTKGIGKIPKEEDEDEEI